MTTATARVVAFRGSQSKRGDFDACAYRAMRIYMMREKQPGNVPMNEGNVGHKVLAHYLDSLNSRGETSDHALLRGLLAEEVEAAGLPEESAARLEAMLDAFIGYPLDLRGHYGTEARFVVDADGVFFCANDDEFFRGRPGKPILWSGVIDWLRVFPDKTARIVDWSTSWDPGTAKVEQLRGYAAAVFAALPNLTRVDVEVYNLRHEAPAGAASFGPEDVEGVIEGSLRWAAGIARRAAAGLTEKNFPATPGTACGYCHVACPVVPDPKRDLSDPAALLADVVLLEAQADRKKALLKGHVAINGPLVAAGHECLIAPTESYNYPTPHHLIETRPNAWELLSVDAAAYKRAARDSEELAALMKPKPGSRFTIHKKKD